ncbi:MAG: NADP-dependent isocitrate dehydrogenase [Anaeromyxobacter sp.]|nr:NADP-dependent isocitrate dehydrogenase [Anaeromyxobacter sp.]MBL0277872.1 NADP-dependent isocitrate dehydrogenase [Anaeromyxobacter sp.]
MAEAKPVLPKDGSKIAMVGGVLQVPDRPIVPYVEGDGVGRDIWRATVRVLDAAVDQAYRGGRKIAWTEVYAGEKAFTKFGSWLPDETIETFREYLVGLKGPLTNPAGGEIRSLNVALRQRLDLYVCLRPVRWIEGVPTPVKHPERVEVVVFRENTEDTYAGIEWEAGSEAAARLLAFLAREFPRDHARIRFPASCGLGLKPISKEGTERLVRAALEYALRHRRRSLTLVHKGNIMRHTEGAFRAFGYALAEREFGARTYTQAQWERTKAARGDEAAAAELAAARAAGRLEVKDVYADVALQQTLTRPEEFDVIATPNLNGDYLSDALAAQVGGIGIAPGGNANYQTGHAVFEATHGTAPRLADLDRANPGSVIRSGELLLRHLGWDEAADLVDRGLRGAIRARRVTSDFARLMRAEGVPGVVEVTCSGFGDETIRHMPG